MPAVPRFVSLAIKGRCAPVKAGTTSKISVGITELTLRRQPLPGSLVDHQNLELVPARTSSAQRADPRAGRCAIRETAPMLPPSRAPKAVAVARLCAARSAPHRHWPSAAGFRGPENRRGSTLAPLAPAASTGARGRQMSGAQMRRWWCGITRITETELAATNRRAGFPAPQRFAVGTKRRLRSAWPAPDGRGRPAPARRGRAAGLWLRAEGCGHTEPAAPKRAAVFVFSTIRNRFSSPRFAGLGKATFLGRAHHIRGIAGPD